MPIILTEEKEKEEGKGRMKRERRLRGGRVGRPVHAQKHTFMLMERMNKGIEALEHRRNRGDRREGEEERNDEREAELGGRGQREIGGERIRL